MTHPEFVPLPDYREYPATEMADRAAAFYRDMREFYQHRAPQEGSTRSRRWGPTIASRSSKSPRV